MKYKDFTEFPVWQRGFNLLIKVYEVTKTFPSEEKFGLVSDMRRAANSVVHNIAEGFGREGTKDKKHFYKFSRGSCFELISQTLVGSALSYLLARVRKANSMKISRKDAESAENTISIFWWISSLRTLRLCEKPNFSDTL